MNNTNLRVKSITLMNVPVNKLPSTYLPTPSACNYDTESLHELAQKPGLVTSYEVLSRRIIEPANMNFHINGVDNDRGMRTIINVLCEYTDSNYKRFVLEVGGYSDSQATINGQVDPEAVFTINTVRVINKQTAAIETYIPQKLKSDGMGIQLPSIPEMLRSPDDIAFRDPTTLSVPMSLLIKSPHVIPARYLTQVNLLADMMENMEMTAKGYHGWQGNLFDNRENAIYTIMEYAIDLMGNKELDEVAENVIATIASASLRHNQFKFKSLGEKAEVSIINSNYENGLYGQSHQFGGETVTTILSILSAMGNLPISHGVFVITRNANGCLDLLRMDLVGMKTFESEMTDSMTTKLHKELTKMLSVSSAEFDKITLNLSWRGVSTAVMDGNKYIIPTEVLNLWASTRIDDNGVTTLREITRRWGDVLVDTYQSE